MLSAKWRPFCLGLNVLNPYLAASGFARSQLVRALSSHWIDATNDCIFTNINHLDIQGVTSHISDYVWERISDYALLDLAIKSSAAISAEVCQLSCLAFTWCRSINYYPKQALCELNTKAWGDDETALNFVRNDSVAEYYYYCTREEGTVKWGSHALLGRWVNQ